MRTKSRMRGLMLMDRPLRSKHDSSAVTPNVDCAADWRLRARMAGLALVAALLATPPVCGALTVVETDLDSGQLVTFKMTVTPAAEPVPALRHRLMLREIELEPGNAAPYYYRALLDVAAARKASEREAGEDDYHDWYDSELVPLNELPLEKVREVVSIWSELIAKHVRVAARKRHCEWDWNVEDLRGPEFLAFSLDEMQDSRWLARALMLHIRLALAEGRIDDAIDLSRLNYRLARDVAKEPLLICDMIGVSIANMGNLELIELIAQANSPNLYWALTELPRPLIGIRSSVRMEMWFGPLTLPFLLDAETTDHSPQEWSRLLAKGLADWQSRRVASAMASPDDPPLLAKASLAGLAMFAYPAAKRRLVEAGMARERVDQMPVGQVIAIDARRQYRRIADELEKWYYVPDRVVREREPPDPIRGVRAEKAAILTGGYGYALAALVLPAIRAARGAEQRLLWQMDGIRTVEAIRMHAAESGRLPKSLDEIRAVPVPENPATGKSFEYALHGNTGVLQLPFSDGFPGIAWRFEITLVE